MASLEDRVVEALTDVELTVNETVEVPEDVDMALECSEEARPKPRASLAEVTRIEETKGAAKNRASTRGSDCFILL